jgi:hypothetical protein
MREHRCSQTWLAQAKWSSLDTYWDRNYRHPIDNVPFSPRDVVLVGRDPGREVWFVLLEGSIYEDNADGITDAALQRMALVEVKGDGSVVVHEDTHILVNAGGGPWDPLMSNLVVTARHDIIARLDYDLGNALIALDLSSFEAQRVSDFRASSPELVPVERDVDIEVMKFFQRSPEHVVEVPGHTFERIIAEILASHGFSDIQLNVRNAYGEMDIIAFDSTQSGRRGYIIECKMLSKQKGLPPRGTCGGNEANSHGVRRCRQGYACDNL